MDRWRCCCCLHGKLADIQPKALWHGLCLCLNYALHTGAQERQSELSCSQLFDTSGVRCGVAVKTHQRNPSFAFSSTMHVGSPCIRWVVILSPVYCCDAHKCLWPVLHGNHLQQATTVAISIAAPCMVATQPQAAYKHNITMC
jgi:hypothetical protein